MKLTDDDTGFIKLILRSSDRGDGWRTVCSLLWRLVDKFPHKELIEAQEDMRDGGGIVRLSDKGKVVAEYLV